MDNIYFTIFMTLWTLYTLFGDDIRMLGTTKKSDPVFYSLTIIAMIFFFLEIVLSCLAKKDYIFGFYFWMDIVSTISMIMDIGWAWKAILGQSSGTTAASTAAKVAHLAR